MSQIGVNEQTPREIVAELDKYIVGQHEAKRSVAIALRNRWRSRQLDADMREDIIPKNILMIGSTGVGKTEIARRLARLVRAPFLKVEATKFTEVGYVGRDVESIVRDLVETSVRMVRQQKIEEVEDKAKENAEERLIDVFVPPPKKSTNPLGSLFSSQEDEPEEKKEEPPKYQAGREWMRKRLRSGELENDVIEVEVEESDGQYVCRFLLGGDERQPPVHDRETRAEKPSQAQGDSRTGAQDLRGRGGGQTRRYGCCRRGGSARCRVQRHRLPR